MNIKLEDLKTLEKQTSRNNGVANVGQSPFELICFDKKTKMYIEICSFLFVFFVVFKLHNSSIALWNSYMPDGESARRGIIAGDPLPIRSDEWLVNTPFILSQEKTNFQVTNESLGYGKVPLVMGLPAYHLLAIIKPGLWGYYFLDKERGFAWHWNFKIFPFLIASFLFLMLFTRNNFMISVFGSCWLFLSSSIQWWSINTEIFTYGIFTLISFIYILYSNKTRLIILNGVVLLLASYSYAMILYPPYQVPLAYFILALLVAYVISRKDFKAIWDKKWVKLSVLAVTGACLLMLFYYFFEDCKDTIRVVSSTVYPGQRIETGGGLPVLRLFQDNFSWFMTQNSFPQQWGNICELSSFLMLSPIAVILILYSFAKTKKINPLFIPLLIFQLLVYTWLFIGFPEFLAKLTLFSLSPIARTRFILGFTNIVFTILYLSKVNLKEDQPAVPRKMAIHFVIIFSIVFVITYMVSKTTDAFFTKSQIFNASILVAALNWLILYFKNNKLYQNLFYIVCLFFVASNLFINPLCKGLSPIFENKIYKAVSEIEEKDPGAKWVVFGHMTAPNFLKMAGINCINGVQFAPPLEKLRILDPTGSRQNIYNRYAHIMFLPFIDGKDSVDFVLQQLDYYHVKMDPSSPKLKQMGIKYVMFGYRPPDSEVKNLIYQKDISGFFIYKRIDL